MLWWYRSRTGSKQQRLIMIDAYYITLQEDKPSCSTKDFETPDGNLVIIDFDEDGKAIGVEIIGEIKKFSINAKVIPLV